MIYKDILKQQQPILYQILLQSFQNQKISHDFLLVGKNASLAAHFIAKSLICEDDILACDQCNECRRIDEHNYGDFIYYNGQDETIKKVEKPKTLVLEKSNKAAFIDSLLLSFVVGLVWGIYLTFLIIIILS